MSNKRCGVPGCNTDYKKDRKDKLSIFTIKKNSSIYTKLIENYGFEQHDELKVCERHYLSKYFIKMGRGKRLTSVGKTQMPTEHMRLLRNETATSSVSDSSDQDEVSIIVS